MTVVKYWSLGAVCGMIAIFSFAGYPVKYQPGVELVLKPAVDHDQLIPGAERFAPELDHFVCDQNTQATSPKMWATEVNTSGGSAMPFVIALVAIAHGADPPTA